MSGFDQGINQFHATKKCPHLQKIKGKPVPVGIEMKASCDCETGILMHLEIQEGKERMASKAYTDIYSNASTACTSRLIQSVSGSGRTVIGDSWFSSVQTAMAMRDFGLNFVGCVKTAHKGFPIAFMKQWDSTNPRPGDMIALLKETSRT